MSNKWSIDSYVVISLYYLNRLVNGFVFKKNLFFFLVKLKIIFKHGNIKLDKRIGFLFVFFLGCRD